MRGKVAKKVRRETRKFWREYLERVAELSFMERLSLAWRIVWARKEEGKSDGTNHYLS